MRREIWFWGNLLLLSGLIHLFVYSLTGHRMSEAYFSISMIVIGIVSYFFKESAMFMLYAVILAWTSIFDILVEETVWLFFGLFQILIVMLVFRKFLIYHQIEAGLYSQITKITPDTPKLLTSVFFPWASIFLSGIALTACITSALLLFSGSTPATGEVGWVLVVISLNFAVISFAVGLASSLGKFQNRRLVIAGMIVSSLLLIGWTFLTIAVRNVP